MMQRLLLVLVGLAIGLGMGWKIGTLRGKRECTFFLSGMTATEIHAQERAASRAYLTQSPEVALWALESLLRTYKRYEQAPEPHPAERPARLRFASAMAHARIADLCKRLHQEELRAQHLQQALTLSGMADEQRLLALVEELNKAEKATLDVPPATEIPVH